MLPKVLGKEQVRAGREVFRPQSVDHTCVSNRRFAVEDSAANPFHCGGNNRNGWDISLRCDCRGEVCKPVEAIRAKQMKQIPTSRGEAEWLSFSSPI
jgi:hypothetical protein